MENKIIQKKIDKYFDVTETALKKVRKKIIRGKEKEAEEIIKMAENYISDAKYFEKTKNLVNCFGALNYAHGWIDAGVRLGIFDVRDDHLFTIK